MPHKGQILTNPITGDQYEFLETARDSNGLRVVMKATIISRGPLVPNHIHLVQDEEFKVESGTLTILSEHKTITLKQGEQKLLPKNRAHNHYNSDREPVSYIHTVRPALDFDYFIENLIGMSADPSFQKRKESPFQKIVSLRYLESKALLSDKPIYIQKFLMYFLAPIARLLGYRALYKKYTGIEK